MQHVRDRLDVTIATGKRPQAVLTIIAPSQCDQIGLFLKGLGDKLTFKMRATYWAMLKNVTI